MRRKREKVKMLGHVHVEERITFGMWGRVTWRSSLTLRANGLPPSSGTQSKTASIKQRWNFTLYSVKFQKAIYFMETGMRLSNVIILKRIQGKWVRWCGLGSSCSGWGPVAGSCEHDIELSDNKLDSVLRRYEWQNTRTEQKQFGDHIRISFFYS
jgi:hypothetical protein